MVIAKTKLFGKFSELAPLVKPVEQQTLQPTKKVTKLPFSRENVRKVTLKALFESTGPVSRKELLEKVRQTLEITSEYLKYTKTKRPRWMAIVSWTIKDLRNEGLITLVEKRTISNNRKRKESSKVYWVILRSMRKAI